MTCQHYQNRLSAFLDGELSRWTRWKVELHVRTCRECGQELRDLAAIDQQLLNGVSQSPCPTYLTDAVMRRLPALPPGRRASRRWTPAFAAMTLAGAQLVALAGAYWVGFNRGAVQGGFFGSTSGIRERQVHLESEPAAPAGVLDAPVALMEPAEAGAATKLVTQPSGFAPSTPTSPMLHLELERERRRRERNYFTPTGGIGSTRQVLPSQLTPQGAH